MRISIILLLCTLASCAERNTIKLINVSVKDGEKLIAELSVYENGGSDFAVIDKGTIILVECPPPEIAADGKVVYKGFTVDLKRKVDGQTSKKNIVSNFIYGGKNKPIGGLGEFQVTVSFK